MKKSLKVMTVLLAIVLLVLSPNITVQAEEYKLEDLDNATLASSVRKNVYTDKRTKVYTGKGIDRWLHISAKSPSGMITILMETYDGEIIWSKNFNANETTHWFIGSNIRYVYLEGTPGYVYVSDTAH